MKLGGPYLKYPFHWLGSTDLTYYRLVSQHTGLQAIRTLTPELLNL